MLPNKIIYNNKTYIFRTNLDKNKLPIFIAIYKKLDIDAIFINEAFGVYGNPLKDMIANYVYEDDYNNNYKINKFYDYLDIPKIHELFFADNEEFQQMMKNLSV